MLRHIPNLFTLLNLVFGCIAIVLILQTGQSIVVLNDNTGTYDPYFPEKMAWGGVFIFFAAAIDFFDGFMARMLKAPSDMGKQLDSLSDVVSFGVAPGMILFQLLRLGFAQQENGLDIPLIALIPAFIFSCAVALRLAKFNISTSQSEHFQGVPSPAAGLLIASFPLIIWNEYFGLQQYFINVWVLYTIILVSSYLMLSRRNFIAVKFKDFSFKNNLIKYILLSVSLILLVSVQWFAVPIIFLLYIILSAFSKVPGGSTTNKDQTTLDVTV